MTDDQTPTCHCADLDLTDRQRTHILGLEARVKELRAQLEQVAPSPLGIKKIRDEAYRTGWSNALIFLVSKADGLRFFADTIDAARLAATRALSDTIEEAQSGCGLCPAYPARGLAEIDGQRYCHGDNDPSPTCYEQAQSRGLS